MKENNKFDYKEAMADAVIREAFERYARDLANEEPEGELTEEQERLIEESSERVYKKLQAQIREEEAMKAAEEKAGAPRKNRKVLKRVVLIAAALILLIGSVSAIPTGAWQKFAYKTYSDVTGTVLNIRTTKAEDISYNIKNFERRDQVVVPDWLPAGMELTKVNDDNIYLRLEYKNEKNWIILIQQRVTENEISTNFETDKNQFFVKDCKAMGKAGKIVEVKYEDGKRAYSVIWNNDLIKYQLITDGDLIMLETVLDELEFLED